MALARIAWRHFAWMWWRQEANMTAYYLLLGISPPDVRQFSGITLLKSRN